jgi:hypothetical protein
MSYFEFHSPAEWLRITTALREEVHMLHGALAEAEARHAAYAASVEEAARRRGHEEEAFRESAKMETISQVENTRQEGSGREARWQQRLDQAHRKSQEHLDHLRESHDLRESERKEWEERHRRAVDRAEKAEAQRARIHEDHQDKTSALQEEQALRVRTEERCQSLERRIAQLMQEVQRVEQEAHEKVSIQKNFAKAQVEARWLKRVCPKTVFDAKTTLPNVHSARAV